MCVCVFKKYGLNLESLTFHRVPWNQQLFRSDKRQYNLQISFVPSKQATHFSPTDHLQAPNTRKLKLKIKHINNEYVTSHKLYKSY